MVCLGYSTLTLLKVFIASKYRTPKLIQSALTPQENGLLSQAKNKANYLYGNGNLKLMSSSSKVISLISILLLIQTMERL
jgi:outer membrane receptor for ferrienterochelin and colicin